jgi:hypothetical protein
MTVPCVHLLFRDDVPLPLALFSTHILSDHLYGSLFQTYSSTRSPPLAPRSRYSLYFTAAIRCEVKKFSTSSFPHRPYPLRVLSLSLYILALVEPCS